MAPPIGCEANKLEKDLTGKLKLLQKTSDIVSEANILATELCKPLIEITGMIEEIKLKIFHEKFERNDDQEAITEWSKNVKQQVEVVDAEVEKLQKHLDEIKANEASKVKDAEWAQQLLFEKEQCDKTTKKLNTDQTQTKLSVINPFGGAPTDWLRFWSVFEAEIDNNSELPAVTKFAHLKEFLKPTVRSTMDG